MTGLHQKQNERFTSEKNAFGHGVVTFPPPIQLKVYGSIFHAKNLLSPENWNAQLFVTFKILVSKIT